MDAGPVAHPTRGRLDDPATTLGTDPRTDPRMRAVLDGVGLLGHADPAPFDRHVGRPTLLGFVDAVEEAFEALFVALASSWPPIAGTTRETRTVAVEGGEITLHVHHPAGRSGPLPVIYQIHGGGMVMLATAGPLYQRWRDELALAGAVVVGVEYRNGGGALGAHPFPTGLRDCAAGLAWVHDHLAELGGTHVVVTGDSGGANLALGLAVAAKQEGRLDRIAGVFAQCPYILGTWEEPSPELHSLWENDGYWLNRELFPLLAEVYDPGAAHVDDPTCWPSRAGVEDVRGLPPHVISCAELDPLRDEGIAYHRLLLAAGVSSVGTVELGVCHVGQLMFPGAMPDVYARAVDAVVSFARRVAP